MSDQTTLQNNNEQLASNNTELTEIIEEINNMLTLEDVMNLMHPIGSYYETSDTAFDPNISWVGTWQLDSVGRITVSQDASQDEFKTIGQTGGEKTHSHTLTNGYAQLKTNKGSSTGGYVAKTVTSYSTNVQFYTSKASTATTDNMTEGVQLSGSTDVSNNLPPYIVVKRWHRTA